MKFRSYFVVAAAWLTLALVPAAQAASQEVRQALSEGRINDVLQELSRQMATAPNDAESYHLLSRAYFALGKWDQAIENGQKAIQLSPNSSDYHLWLGRAYGEKAGASGWFTAMRNAKHARQEFEKAVQLNSSNIAARTDLAEFYFEAPGLLGGGKDKALAQADVIATSNPNSESAAHWIKARIAEKEGHMEDAETEYKKAIEVAKNPAPDWLNLAGFYHDQKRIPEMNDAIHKAANAVSIQKKKANVLVEAAGLLFRSGQDMNEAMRLVRNYLNSNEKNEEAPAFKAHYLLGQILEKQGNKNGAADEYRAALALASDYRDAQDGLKRVSQ
jgi:tetratricopeptide (TPR) repeat protein